MRWSLLCNLGRVWVAIPIGERVRVMVRVLGRVGVRVGVDTVVERCHRALSTWSLIHAPREHMQYTTHLGIPINRSVRVSRYSCIQLYVCGMCAETSSPS